MTNKIVLNYKYLLLTCLCIYFTLYISPTQAYQMKGNYSSNNPFQGCYLTLVLKNLGSQHELESIEKVTNMNLFMSMCLFPLKGKWSS